MPITMPISVLAEIIKLETALDFERSVTIIFGT